MFLKFNKVILSRQIFENAIKQLCEDTCAIGYVDIDEIAKFDEKTFNFDEVVDVCHKVPCLFLAYNKENIHVYFRIPKVMLQKLLN